MGDVEMQDDLSKSFDGSKIDVEDIAPLTEKQSTVLFVFNLILAIAHIVQVRLADHGIERFASNNIQLPTFLLCFLFSKNNPYVS
jgi:hypothetical protein